MQKSERRRGAGAPMGLAAVIGFGLVACVLYGVGAGLRGDIGILLTPLSEHCQLPYADVSFCIAVMNLVFGAAQPAFGLVAARRSNRFVLLCGAGLLAASLVGMALSRNFWTLFLSLGLLFGLGAGALAFGLILSSAMRRVGPERAMMISGMLNAAAGLGAFVLSPTIQGLLDAGGTTFALSALLVPVAALVPIAFVVTSADGKGDASAPNSAVEPGGVDASTSSESPTAPSTDAASSASTAPSTSTSSGASLFRRAFSNRTFLLLLAGFSTCGFHMVIIESHLFSQYISYDIPATSASWAFSLYGIATIFGALLSGWLSVKVPKGRLLVFYYGFRALWVLGFIFLCPKSLVTAILFSAGLGLTGDATVSPTAGLVNQQFSLAEAATLIGVLFFGHQIGGFLSAWLGGVLLGATGSYTLLWVIDAVLCTLAALASARIRG
ncbi:MAG: MFS transporter [Eggerthellaceae bacterium]|nr:MFS transporter [Eggerthellaceae bacterium]